MRAVGQRFLSPFRLRWPWAAPLALPVGALIPAPLALGPHHPQIGQGKQGDQQCRVLLELTVAGFDIAKLALDYPKRMLHLDSNPGLGFFNLICQLIKRIALVQGPVFAWAHPSSTLPHRFSVISRGLVYMNQVLSQFFPDFRVV
jgi:hypothetical protein